MSAQYSDTFPPLPETASGKSWMDICSELWVRRALQLPVARMQREMSNHYNGRIVVPLPEIDATERPAVANLIAQDIDQQAMRIASTAPSKEVYPLRAGSQKDAKTARTQRRVLFDWDDQNQMNLFDRRRARWLVALAQAPVLVRPNAYTRGPSWELRNPISTYPSVQSTFDNMRPDDCIFTYVRSFQWLETRYPAVTSVLQVSQGRRKYQPDDKFEMVEFVDEDVLVMGVLGSGQIPPFTVLGDLGYAAIPMPANTDGQTYALELERVPNLAGTCTAVIPGRVTIDMPKGQMDGMIGLYQAEAKMMALHVNATARAIYPDTWFVEAPTGGEIVTMADGLTGVVGHVRGGAITTENMQPGVQTVNTLNMLERAMRLEGAAPAEFGGESPTNVRTAQRGLNVASNAIDFFIQEHQEILAIAKQYEYEIAATIDKEYFKKDQKSFYVAWGKERGEVSYVPGKLWETVPKIGIKYNYAGMDANAVALVTGQKLNEGLISRTTAMSQDPSITDVEQEQGLVLADRLGDALLTSVSQQLASGAINPADGAQLMMLVESGDFTLAQAVAKVQAAAQARQATPAPAGSPATQVGLQGGAAGAAQPIAPTTLPPSQGQMNLKDLLASLAKGQSVAPQPLNGSPAAQGAGQ